MCGSSHLKFEMVVWANGRNVGPEYKRVKVHNGDSFPYLDTKIWYSEEGRLKWGLYKKPNQVLKYLNGGSTHTNACKNAISKGVFDRAVRLTYLEEKDYDTPVNDLFEEQAKALEVAQVAPNPYPTVYQVAQRLWENAHRKDTRIQIPPKFKSKVDSDDDDSTIDTALTDDDSFSTTSESSISSNDSTVIAANTKAAKKKNQRKRRARKKKRKRKPRGVNFVIPYSTFWSGEPIHAVIKRLKDKFDLRWLRFSMSYKRFSNVRELYRADLDRKLDEGLESEDFKTRDCNCKGSNRREGNCIYGENCRKKVLIYKIKCRHCSKFYIGSTYDCLKSRADGHCSATCAIANKSKYAKVWRTAWSNHANTHLGISHPDGPPYQYVQGRFTVPTVKTMMDFELMWHCNGILASKSFGKRNCILCNQERVEIVRAMKSSKNNQLLNRDLKIGSKCIHKARFHNFTRNV